MNELKTIARIHTDFPTKFGVPRQSGLVPQLKAEIVFEPEFRDPDALRGIDGFSHLWVLWGFSQAERDTWSATVRPPRLGGNTRVGVFATRSPFRPNSIGLSSVRLEEVREEKGKGVVLVVSGADMLDGTPIYDIKPYIPYSDSHPDAVGGFSDEVQDHMLNVDFPDRFLEMIPESKRDALLGVLAQDPRPSYIGGGERVYGMPFDMFDIKFTVNEKTLTVCDIIKLH